MDLTITLLRPDDLVALTVDAINLRLDTSDPARPRLVRQAAGLPALLVYQFAPQSVGEQAFFETAAVTQPSFNPPPSNPPLPPPPPLPGAESPQPPGTVQARMSGGSRLAFRLPDSVHQLPYTIAGLLDWSALIPVLPPAAEVPPSAPHAPGQSPPAIAEPGPQQTALELPYRLVLAPNVAAQAVPAWLHATTPVERAGRTELWHTRLGARAAHPGGPGGPGRPCGAPAAEASDTHPVPARAVWSPDFVADGPLPPHTTDTVPFRSAMSARDRDQIVILSAGFAGYTITEPDGSQNPYLPRPVAVERLFLSALGGWLSSRGSWDYPVSYQYVPIIRGIGQPQVLEQPPAAGQPARPARRGADRMPPGQAGLSEADRPTVVLPTVSRAAALAGGQPAGGQPAGGQPAGEQALAAGEPAGQQALALGHHPDPHVLGGGQGVLHEVAALDLVEWDHVATQGRDHYVRIVYEGFLYPFGHRASLVKITERKVHAPHGTEGNPDDSPVAYLRQRMYIVVREREKSYLTAPFQFAGLEMPLRERVAIKTHITPEIDPPAFIGDASFRIDVNGAPYPFPLTGTDLAGHQVNFLAPLMFVSLSETQLTVVRDTYASANDLRRCDVRGRNIAYADPLEGDTILKTTALYFTAELTSAGPPYVTAPFLPSLDTAAVTVPSIAALTGQNTAVLVAYYPPYLQHGLDPHAAVFVQVVGSPAPVPFSADASGGFARPNIGLSALSARKGLVSGDPDDAAKGAIDPAAYFGDIDARLFGAIPLGELIPLDAITRKADAAQNSPEIRTRAVPNRRHPTQFVTLINWEPQLQDYKPAGSPVSIVFNSDGQVSALRLHVHLETHLDGSPPTSQAQGKLTSFELRLFGVIALKIASITFDSANGAKSTVNLQLVAQRPIAFEGPLQFIQTLADILPPGLFGGIGPSITLTPTALRVTYTLGLPPITCGVFSLEHIAIMAGLDLPYLDGKPAVEFAFASRPRPFLVTVEIFGGGGFVHVVLDADGIRMVEGAIEFGANYSIDFGVASGAVHAMAGIYFQLKGSSSDLTGFIDIGGELSVLGIISVSIDLNLSLSWQHSPAGNIIEGRATLTISVHILFFSASVQLSVERSFSAGGGDPKVDQLMSGDQWSQYAMAFG